MTHGEAQHGELLGVGLVALVVARAQILPCLVDQATGGPPFGLGTGIIDFEAGVVVHHAEGIAAGLRDGGQFVEHAAMPSA